MQCLRPQSALQCQPLASTTAVPCAPRVSSSAGPSKAICRAFFWGGGGSRDPAVEAGAVSTASALEADLPLARIPSPAIAARAPCSTMGPGMGAALEASCPVSRSLEASRAPTPPSPLDVVQRGMRLLGGGGGDNVRTVSPCPVFPLLLCPYLVSFLFSFSSPH